jgi:hypothetical protein
MNADTVKGAFSLNPGATGTITFDNSNKIASFTPSAPLSPNTTYTVTVGTGAQSQAGVSLAAAQTWNFKTAPVPVVLFSSPTGTSNPVVPSLKAYFSEIMDSTLIPLSLKNAVTGAPVAVVRSSYSTDAVTCNKMKSCATFTPAVSLDSGFTYTASFGTDVKSLAGVALAAPYAWSFTVGTDLVPPDLTVSTLADGAATKDPTLNISGTVTDNIGVKSLTINDGAVTVNSDGSFHHTLQLVPGPNTITIVAADFAGTKKTGVRTVSLDQKGPTITVTAPADNGKTGKSFIDVTGSIDEAGTVELKVNNGTPQIASMSGNGFSATVNLAAGLNTIDIVAKDQLGNTSSAKRSITYDNQAPTLAVTSPDQDILTSENLITIKGTVADTLSAANVSVIVKDGGSYTPPVTSGAFEQTIIFAGEKTYELTVRARDEAGNEVTSQRNIIYSLPDLNGDGRVDIADALKTLRIAVGLITPSASELRRGDVAPWSNGRPSPDGVIDVKDALVMLKKVTGLVRW